MQPFLAAVERIFCRSFTNAIVYKISPYGVEKHEEENSQRQVAHARRDTKLLDSSQNSVHD